LDFSYSENKGTIDGKMKDRVKQVYIAIYGLNFVIIVFLSMTMYFTIFKICDDYQARDFLEMARYLPHVAWTVPTYTIICFTLIGISNVLKEGVFKNQPVKIIFLYIADLILFGLITYLLNFSYKGFFLFITAGLFLFVNNMSVRLITLAITLICFILFDYDLLTVRIHLLSFQDYIDYYDPNIQIYLYSIKSALDSANLILVVLFFYMFIHSKIRENKEFVQLNNRLKENLAKLKIANVQLEEAGRMKERNRLAHEIHDILGHSLTCISTGLEASMEVTGTSNPVLARQLQRIKEVSDKGLMDIRRSVKELKVDVIVKSSLIEAIHELIANINALGKQRAFLEISGEPVTLQHDEELTVYRLVQESTTNAIRHGKAEDIFIKLTYGQDQLAIAIRDNGLGCHHLEKNFGLSHMEEQVQFLGGSISFITEDGGGFTTSAFIPLRKEGIDD
jgi:signal transduction histidine kinase